MRFVNNELNVQNTYFSHLSNRDATLGGPLSLNCAISICLILSLGSDHIMEQLWKHIVFYVVVILVHGHEYLFDVLVVAFQEIYIYVRSNWFEHVDLLFR